MKKCVFPAAWALLTIAFLPVAAQQNCDQLKKENDYLRQALKMSEPIMTQTVDNTEIKLISCIGDAKAQTVKLTFLLNNKKANKDVTLSKESGVDMEGNQYDSGYEGFKIGNGGQDAVINTDVPIKAAITLKKILPEVKVLRLLKFNYRSETTSYPYIDVEFRDIKVDWK